MWCNEKRMLGPDACMHAHVHVHACVRAHTHTHSFYKSLSFASLILTYLDRAPLGTVHSVHQNSITSLALLTCWEFGVCANSPLVLPNNYLCRFAACSYMSIFFHSLFVSPHLPVSLLPQSPFIPDSALEKLVPCSCDSYTD